MLRLKERLARLEAASTAKGPTDIKRWFCDVRFGHSKEDIAAGFAAAGVEPGPHDIIRAIVHMPHQWSDNHRPYASLTLMERSPCPH